MYGSYSLHPHGSSYHHGNQDLVYSSNPPGNRYNSEKKASRMLGAVPQPHGVEQKIIDAYLNQTKSTKSLYKVKKQQSVVALSSFKDQISDTPLTSKTLSNMYQVKDTVLNHRVDGKRNLKKM